jgi:GNAT superfamily N-acetyltransferase
MPPNEPGAPIDAFRSILRLLVGGSLEVAELLHQWLEDGEARQSALLAENPPAAGETAGQQAVYVSLALLFASYEVTRRGLGRVVHTTGRVTQFWLGAFAPARRMLGSWVSDHESDLERWIRTGRVEALRSRGVARHVASNTVNQVMDFLTGNPAIDNILELHLGNYQRYLKDHPEDTDRLVEAVAANYLAYLQEHPEQVESLIREQGDGYIDHLNKNPESVQVLLAGQSTGLATELVEEVRERTVSADNVFEMIARSILRRTPREELPEPPPEVQRRAERAVLPSDLQPTEVDRDARL